MAQRHEESFNLADTYYKYMHGAIAIEMSLGHFSSEELEECYWYVFNLALGFSETLKAISNNTTIGRDAKAPPLLNLGLSRNAWYITSGAIVRAIDARCPQHSPPCSEVLATRAKKKYKHRIERLGKVGVGFDFTGDQTGGPNIWPNGVDEET